MGAWHRHTFGGNGAVSHLAVIPARHGGRDELWLSIRREIDGRTVHYIETLEPGHELGEAQEDAFFVDSGLSFLSATPRTEISGLNHLEGCLVSILGDGGVQPERTVKGGRIELEYPAKVVQVGLPYTSIFETVNMEFNLQDGTTQGRRKRIVNITLRLIESGGGVIGMTADSDQPSGAAGAAGAGNVSAGPGPQAPDKGPGGSLVEYRRGSDRMNQAPPLFTGDVKVPWPRGRDTHGRITIAQTFPLPFLVAGMMPEVVLGE
jgi:hypothetical protein